MSNEEQQSGPIETPELDIKQRLNLQTAKINWSELSRFFASGKAISIDRSLDLIEVAAAMHHDDAAKIKDWMSEALVAPVSDQQALDWTDQNPELWAVVVSPWVLIQLPASK